MPSVMGIVSVIIQWCLPVRRQHSGTLVSELAENSGNATPAQKTTSSKMAVARGTLSSVYTRGGSREDLLYSSTVKTTVLSVGQKQFGNFALVQVLAFGAGEVSHLTDSGSTIATLAKPSNAVRLRTKMHANKTAIQQRCMSGILPGRDYT
jgi:hypothetical protein